MFILSDKFTLKKHSHSWELIEKIPSDHHKTKGGFVLEQRWYPTLDMVFCRMFDVEVEDTGGDLSDLKKSIDKALEKIIELIKDLEKKM